MARKGAIRMEAGSARGIRLVKHLAIRLSEQTTLAKSLVMVEQLGLPLIGSVAAGSPLLAVENQRGKTQIPPAWRTR